MKERMAPDLSKLDLLVIQIDGIHLAADLVLLAAVGVDVMGNKYPLGVIEGASKNAAVVQALLGNLIERGLDPNRETSADLAIRLIADNYATHKHAKIKAWLAKHPRFHMYFTPSRRPGGTWSSASSAI